VTESEVISSHWLEGLKKKQSKHQSRQPAGRRFELSISHIRSRSTGHPPITFILTHKFSNISQKCERQRSVCSLANYLFQAFIPRH
jgi:hypothetical protein